MWPGHQAEVAADLDEVASGVEGQLESTSGAGVEDAQPVAGGLDVGPTSRAEVLVPIEGYRGRYVLHCHNLEHEDRMMMADFSVV